MPVKIARSTPRPSFGLPEPLVGIHTSRQSCCKAAKARPLHIHINPFRVTEFFDPNESFVDKTGTLVDRYVIDKDAALIDGQCRLDLDKEATWKPCYDTRKSDWWDVFAIPAARVEKGKVIPGYFKMRTRFVDYHGLYVMHCHILIHEDRGMMFRVEVLNAKSAPAAVGHH